MTQQARVKGCVLKVVVQFVEENEGFWIHCSQGCGCGDGSSSASAAALLLAPIASENVLALRS